MRDYQEFGALLQLRAVRWGMGTTHVRGEGDKFGANCQLGTLGHVSKGKNAVAIETHVRTPISPVVITVFKSQNPYRTLGPLKRYPVCIQLTGAHATMQWIWQHGPVASAERSHRLREHHQ